LQYKIKKEDIFLGGFNMKYKKSILKRSLAFMAVILITFCFPLMAHAETSTSSRDEISATDGGSILSPTEGYSSSEPTVSGRDAVKGNIDQANQVYAGYVDVMPKVSTNDLINWTLTKGNEIIYYLQICVQPFTTIFFIINALMCLVGSIGRGDMVGKGMWGMILSAIVYAAVLYAPVILQTFVGWVGN
jgi:hypothetical protein